MALPTNVYQNVQTYQNSELASLLNQFAFISQANKKFDNFEKLTANLGDTVTFNKPTRFSTADSLVATFQGTEQRIQSLTVDQAKNVSMLFSNQQLLFNQERYMGEIGIASTKQLGTSVEINVAQNAITNTYRYFGDGVTAINSFGQLATAVAELNEYGVATGKLKGFLSNLAVPAIINTGFGKFTPKRADETSMTWELGDYGDADWYRSNLLPTHTAGTVGNDSLTLVVTGVTTDADGGISAIACSVTHADDANAIKAHDLFKFSDGVSGQTNVRYRTFIGHSPTELPVKFAATADAGIVSNAITFSCNPKLYSAAGNKQNITTAIVAGMELTALPSHKAGVLYSGNALFLAMPQLPTQPPFDTWNKMDTDSGCSFRKTYGSRFGENEQGMVNDVIWGSTLVDEYAMRIVFPL